MLYVAEWHAARRIAQLDLDYDSPLHQWIHEEEFRKARDLGPLGLEEELTRIKAWEDGGKWDDAEFVRAELVEDCVNGQIRKRNEQRGDYWIPTKQERAELHSEQAALVDAMTPEQRVADLRQRRADVELADKRRRLAQHFTDIQSMRVKLSYRNGRRGEIHLDLLETFEEMSRKKVNEEFADLQRWGAGEKWTDAEYLRNLLIFESVDERIDEIRAERFDHAAYYRPTPRDWERFCNEAATFVKSVSSTQHRALLGQVRDEAQLRWETEGQEPDESLETARIAADAWGETFGLHDVLFVGFAVVFAYGIGRGVRS